MNILVANIGSTSFKYRVFGSEQQVLAQGRAERVTDYGAAIRACMQEIDGIPVSAIGFKAVHAGPLTGAQIVDERVLAQMERFTFFAPAHNPPYIAAMRSFARELPGTPLVALFETAFFQHVPEAARAYAVPCHWAKTYGVRRYGFHGASHRAASERAHELMRRNDIRHISCHLGGSSSIAAIRNGVAIDTSFGMSPQCGLPQSNRTGDLDVFAALYVMEREGCTPAQMAEILGSQSGLAGMSGTSGDMRDLTDAAASGNSRAQLAIDAYVYQIRKYIGSFLVALGGLDILTFSGGIGENSPELRAQICANLEEFGITIDGPRNDEARSEAWISEYRSHVRVQIVPADEERIVARATADALQVPMSTNTLDRSLVEQIVREVVLKHIGARPANSAPTLAVHASARHMHVSRADFDILFGPGRELTPFRDLYQEGNYAAKETVTLIGPRSRVISNLRILGPMRKESQIELAFTDAIGLGFDDIPIRMSGKIEDTPGAHVMGPNGMVQLTRGLIRAAIHVHMSPAEAAFYGVKQGDLMKLRIGGDAELIFQRVIVRIDPKSRLNVHMDTDEANACGLHLAREIELLK